MGDYLMAEKIKIDPRRVAAPFAAAEYVTVKVAGCGEVVDWKREMEEGRHANGI
jgi:hypothetical protein